MPREKRPTVRSSRNHYIFANEQDQPFPTQMVDFSAFEREHFRDLIHKASIQLLGRWHRICRYPPLTGDCQNATPKKVTEAILCPLTRAKPGEGARLSALSAGGSKSCAADASCWCSGSDKSEQAASDASSGGPGVGRTCSLDAACAGPSGANHL
jgi:hypothetical protein